MELNCCIKITRYSSYDGSEYDDWQDTTIHISDEEIMALVDKILELKKKQKILDE